MALDGETVLVPDTARLRTIRAAGSALGEIARALRAVFGRERGQARGSVLPHGGPQCRRR